MEYKPTDMQRRAKQERYVEEFLAPHLLVLRYLRQHLQPCGAVDTHTTLSIYRLVMASIAVSKDIRYVHRSSLLILVHIHYPEKGGCSWFCLAFNLCVKDDYR